VDAELARAVRRAGLAGAKLGPRRLATIHVRLARVLDLTTEPNRAALGVTGADLTADDSSLPQRIGEAAHRLGYEAVLAPSAAGSGQVLAIFLEELAPGSNADVVAVREGYRPDAGVAGDAPAA